MLRTVDPYVYNPPVKMTIPKKILAQYEIKIPKKPMSYTNGFATSRSRISEIMKPTVYPKMKIEV